MDFTARLAAAMTENPNRTNLCLVTAVDVEFKTAIGLLGQTILSVESKFKICRGFVADRRVTVLQTGMGARGFAEWFSEHLKTNRYDALVVVGLAGGLDPKLKTGDAVVYELCLDARSQSVEIRCDERLTESLFEALQLASLRSFRGTGITVSRIVIDAAEKLLLGGEHQALAVDMESFDVLRVAAEFGLPAAAVRVVSDEAESDLPNFNYAFNYAAEPDGKMNYQRMITAMLKRPTATLRFLRNLKSVIDALRKSLEVVLRP
ncbi:MAG: hypothetical protein ACRD82_15860 [Blastocatellia bacterium]